MLSGCLCSWLTPRMLSDCLYYCHVQVLLQSGPRPLAARQQELCGATSRAVNQPCRQLQDRRTRHRRPRGHPVSVCVCVYYMCIQADWVSQTPKPRRLILNVLFGSKQSVFQFDLKWNTTPGSYCDGKLHSGTDFPSVIHSPLSQDMWSSPIKAKSRQDKGGVIFKEVRFIATICLMFSQ